MQKVRALFLPLAVAALPAFAAVAVADLRAFAQRVPTLPPDSVAALAAAPQTGLGGRKLPAAMAKLRADLLVARQADALGVTAGSGVAPTQAQSPAQTQAQAEAMAAKLKNMSQSEQIAYAMQMQQQMMATPTVGAISLSAAEADAIHKIQADQVSLNADQQQLVQLQMRGQRLIIDWDAQDQALSNQRTQAGKDAGSAFADDSFVCSEASRATLIEADTAHKTLADQQLLKAAALDKEFRAQETLMIGRADEITTLASRISNKTMLGLAATSRQSATGNVLSILDAHAEFYAEASSRAAVWSHSLNAVRAAKIGVCNGL